MTRRAPLVVVVVAWLAASARAEPPPLPREPEPAAPEPAAEPEPVVAPVPSPVAVPAEEAWQLYHRAFAALARRQAAEARSLLEGLVIRFPGHPAARRASAVLGKLSGAAPSQVLARREAAEPRPGEPESPTRLARAELAIFQTFHGAILGGEICIMADCDDAGAAVGLVLIGGVTGAVASVAATSGGIEPGRRGAIDSGVAWGAFNGGMVLLIAQPDEVSTIGGVLVGAQLSGLVAGDLVWRGARPTEGQVALTNTFGIWAGVGALLGMAAVDAEADEEDIATALLVAADAGLVTGAVVASRVPMSRGRTLLIDAGGIVGGLAGGGTAILIGGEETEEQAAAGAALAGMAVGLGTAAFLSRDWDAVADPPARLALFPVAGGGLGGGLSFELE